MGLIPNTSSEDYKHAEKVMMICILSIVVTTPPLAIFMDGFGHRFLKKDLERDSTKEHDNSSLPNENVEHR